MAYVGEGVFLARNNTTSPAYVMIECTAMTRPQLDPFTSLDAEYTALHEYVGGSSWGQNFRHSLNEKLLYYSYIQSYESKNLKFTI